ncbi:helix-turn-helix domain-containing protein [Pseudonocardia endophytica]|uniref:XRE family transcriptional regulator n=1 Tax=Pseudonocardia endophytica TaxID=401976 RepID=A0A4V2PIG3_PSEEN|nr:XRE family transcriptional regulator [Pseudonocardia endophytica]TCK24436.1 XRE family transcriptional regulator [Pseudonocardia endophytica]
MAGAATLPDDGAPAVGGEAERDAIVRAIGPKVRQLRQDNGLSLQQLARRADVSAAAIHKVERGDMVPTVTTLLKLASALGRPMGHFVDGDGEPPAVAHHVHADDRPAAPSLPGVAESVVSGPPERFTVRGRITDVEPGAGLEPDRHGGEDLLLVLDGALDVSVGDERYTLSEGDSLHFPADHRVRVHNATSDPARVLRVSSRGN